MDSCAHQWVTSEKGTEEICELCGERREADSAYPGPVTQVTEELFQRWKQGDVDAERKVWQELYLASQRHADMLAQGFGFSPDNPSENVEQLIHEARMALSDAFEGVTDDVKNGKFQWQGEKALLSYYWQRAEWVLLDYRKREQRLERRGSTFSEREREDDGSDPDEDLADVIDYVSFQVYQHGGTSDSDSDQAALSKERAEHRLRHRGELADEFRRMGTEGQDALAILEELVRSPDALSNDRKRDVTERLQRLLGLSQTTVYRRLWTMHEQATLLRLQCQQCMSEDDERQSVLAPVLVLLNSCGRINEFKQALEPEGEGALDWELEGVRGQPEGTPPATEELVRLCQQLAEFLKSNPDCLKKLRFEKQYE